LAPFTSVEEFASTAVSEPLPESTTQERRDDAQTVSVEQPLAVATVSINTASDPAPVSLEPQVQMELSFSGDCWTEVSDGSGRRLYYDLGQSGRVIALSGDAPLHVILGDSANVSITVDGRAYPIPASARTGRLARLDISGR
jgi:cytoskeleton protein RodZ